MCAQRVDIDENRSVWTADKEPYRPTAPLSSNLDLDVAIIGGGFTGVSTAWHMLERFPDLRVGLIEAGQLANGASGRNGGMMLNWINGVDYEDPERARRIFDLTRGGIDWIVDLVAQHGLKVGLRREGCLEVFTDTARAESAAQEAEHLQAAGLPIRWLDRAALSERLRLQGAQGALLDPTAGLLDGVSLIRAMRPLLLARGLQLFEQTPVLRVREGRICELEVPGARVRARAVVLATNAYTPRLGYFKSGLFPLHSHVIATRPLSAAEQQGIGWGEVAAFNDDLDRISFSGLDPRGRVVFGGGGNFAYGYRYGGRTTWESESPRRFEAIHRRLLSYLPGLEGVPLEHRWTGPIGVTLSRVCSMGVTGEHKNVYYALGYSGHGVTLANLAGRVLTDLFSDHHEPWRDLPFYQQRLLPIPPDPFRWAGYHAFSKITGRAPRGRL